MIDLVRHGGPPVWFILLFGAIALVNAVLHAWRPEERKVAFLRAMTLAVVFSAIAGFTAGVAKSIDGLSRLPSALQPRAPMLLLKGTAEAMADIILGATLLSLAWFIAAIGVRRQRPGDGPGLTS